MKDVRWKMEDGRNSFCWCTSILHLTSFSMLVLGIETSCDETSAAVVEDGRWVRSCVIASCERDFERLGGVIPEDAARRQLESILPVLHTALRDANITGQDLDLIAVTSSPGLLGSLLVGTTTARALAAIWNVPLVAVHHTLGHLSSTWLLPFPPPPLTPTLTPTPSPTFPLLTLSISGGHTDLWYRTAHTSGMLVGSTRDDAAGEAFDKGAAMLGLPYPGGPRLMQLARRGNASAYNFPLPLKNESTLDFSFSGLKTSLKYLLQRLPAPAQTLPGKTRADIAASYQRAICEHLSHQVHRALARFPDATELHVVGGVAANTVVRQSLSAIAHRHGIVTRFPMDIRNCTDNGAMIAAAGYFLAREKPELVDQAFTTQATVHLSTMLA